MVCVCNLCFLHTFIMFVDEGETARMNRERKAFDFWGYLFCFSFVYCCHLYVNSFFFFQLSSELIVFADKKEVARMNEEK